MRIEDISGRIDVNAADPILIGALLDALDADPEGGARALAVRGTRRFVDLRDFASVAGVPPIRWPDLARLATLRSGRRGLSPDWVAGPLRTILEDRGIWTAQGLPEALAVSPSYEVYAAMAEIDGVDWPVGTLLLGGSPRQRRILALGEE